MSVINSVNETALREAERVLSENLRNGHHPFHMLEQFKIRNEGRAYASEHTFLEAFVRVARQRSQSDLDDIQLDILDKAKPVWDFAEDKFSGKFFISFAIHRSLRDFAYRLCLILRLENNDDADQLAVMLRLGGLEEVINLKYE